jgi:hypothetical protein
MVNDKLSSMMGETRPARVRRAVTSPRATVWVALAAAGAVGMGVGSPLVG